MKAFVETPITKEELIAELKWHQEQDNFVKGRYFEEGKGCAVGCSLESLSRKKGIEVGFANHEAYEANFGIPEWLANVEDRLFEGMSVERSKVWPVEFMEAINVGSDLNKVKFPFLKIIVSSILKYIPENKYEGLKESVKELESLLEKGVDDKAKYLEVRDRIRKGRAYAGAAADYAAAYAGAAADYAAAYAGAAADAAAEYAAYAAAYAADTAADYATYAAARRTKSEKFADELLNLIRNCH